MSRCRANCGARLLSVAGLAQFAIDNLGLNPGSILIETTIDYVVAGIAGYCSPRCQSRLRLVVSEVSK